MRMVLVVLASFALLAPAAASPVPEQAADAARAARTAFILKCFRDRTPKSCEAPPEARVRPVKRAG